MSPEEKNALKNIAEALSNSADTDKKDLVYKLVNKYFDQRSIDESSDSLRRKQAEEFLEFAVYDISKQYKSISEQEPFPRQEVMELMNLARVFLIEHKQLEKTATLHDVEAKLKERGDANMDNIQGVYERIAYENGSLQKKTVSAEEWDAMNSQEKAQWNVTEKITYTQEHKTKDLLKQNFPLGKFELTPDQQKQLMDEILALKKQGITPVLHIRGNASHVTFEQDFARVFNQDMVTKFPDTLHAVDENNLANPEHNKDLALFRALVAEDYLQPQMDRMGVKIIADAAVTGDSYTSGIDTNTDPKYTEHQYTQLSLEYDEAIPQKSYELSEKVAYDEAPDSYLRGTADLFYVSPSGKKTILQMSDNIYHPYNNPGVSRAPYYGLASWILRNNNIDEYQSKKAFAYHRPNESTNEVDKDKPRLIIAPEIGLWLHQQLKEMKDKGYPLLDTQKTAIVKTLFNYNKNWIRQQGISDRPREHYGQDYRDATVKLEKITSDDALKQTLWGIINYTGKDTPPKTPTKDVTD